MTDYKKSPYEIRTELLVLAEKIVYERNSARSAAEGKDHNIYPADTDEIIEEAERLNEFVSQKKQQ